MKKLWIPIIILLGIVIIASAISTVQANYETKTSIINKFKALVTAHPTQSSYVSIGKSVLGKDILMFRFGNCSSNGRVLWDAQIHGTEDAGSETGYLFCVWLFSGDSRANYILGHNWILMIPVVNIDEYNRVNAHQVNLNRNFPVGWGPCGTSTPTSAGDYRGSYAASEPETKALVNVFKTYKLKFYINTHTYGGPGFYVNTAIPSSVITTLKSRLATYSKTYGGNPASTNWWSHMSGGGFAMSTAETYGAYSFLWEIGPGKAPYATLSQIQNQYYKETRCFLIAICSMCG